MLMDVRMPGVSGLDAAREIKVQCPDTKVLMLTTYEDLDYLFEAVKAGAAGYVIKDATKRELVDAVRRALGGQSSLDRELSMRLLQRLGREDDQGVAPSSGTANSRGPLRESLTPRELEVLRLLAQGLTNRQISQELVVSAATVKVHIEHLIAQAWRLRPDPGRRACEPGRSSRCREVEQLKRGLHDLVDLGQVA